MKKYNAMWATNCKQGNWVLCSCYWWSVLIMWEVRGVWWELCLKVTKYRARRGRPVASNTVMIQFIRSYCTASSEARPGQVWVVTTPTLGLANMKFSALSILIVYWITQLPGALCSTLTWRHSVLSCVLSPCYCQGRMFLYLTIDTTGDVKYGGDWRLVIMDNFRYWSCSISLPQTEWMTDWLSAPHSAVTSDVIAGTLGWTGLD